MDRHPSRFTAGARVVVTATSHAIRSGRVGTVAAGNEGSALVRFDNQPGAIAVPNDFLCATTR